MKRVLKTALKTIGALAVTYGLFVLAADVQIAIHRMGTKLATGQGALGSELVYPASCLLLGLIAWSLASQIASD